MLNTLSSPAALRAVVWFDAATGVLLGTLHLSLAQPLADWWGLPRELVWASGWLLLGYAALAAAVGAAAATPRGPLWALIIGNLAWSGASLILLVGGVVQPTLLGQAYLLVHVVSVAVLAELQWLGARRLPRAPRASLA